MKPIKIHNAEVFSPPSISKGYSVWELSADSRDLRIKERLLDHNVQSHLHWGLFSNRNVLTDIFQGLEEL